MQNIDMENYIKDLSPELQEKARACRSNSELLELAAENDLEIPMDALEGVAGGCGGSSKKNYTVCNVCNSDVQNSVPSGTPKPVGVGTYYWCPKCNKVVLPSDVHTESR